MTKSLGKIGPANIMKHLKGTHFPISKEMILNHVKSGHGPDADNVLMILEQLPEQDYSSPAEIMREVGKIK